MKVSSYLSKIVFITLFLVKADYALAYDYNVDLTNTGSSTIINGPVTFAYPFNKGEFPGAQEFVGRLSNGQTISVQTDHKARHADGSLRHAIFSLVLPELGAQKSLKLTLLPGDAPAGQDITLSDLSGSGLDTTVTLNISGTQYSANFRDSVQSPASQWLSGPIASEWIYVVPLKANNSNHPHLVARFNVRSYGNISNAKIDVVVENNWTFVGAVSDITYDASIDVMGSQKFSFDSLVHFQRARWKETVWSDNKPAIHIAHNAATLIGSKAVPSYDSNLIGQIDQNQYGSVDFDGVKAVSGGKTGAYSPMGIGKAQSFMPNTGGRRDIGPLPDWAASYILDQGKNTRSLMLEMADTAGSWSIHYRDKSTDLPVSINDHPSLSLHYNSSFRPQQCGGACSSPYTADDSHQPSFAYVPYLVTGDFFYLEELHFWTNYNAIIVPEPSEYRDGSKGYFYGQIRSVAWGLRTLGHSAYITPDGHALKQYFTTILNNNIEKLTAKYIGAGELNSYGAFVPYGNYAAGALSMWQDDFLTWSVANLVELGFSNAKPFADWKAKFPVQRLGEGYSGNPWCWTLATTYLLNGVYSGGVFTDSMTTLWNSNHSSYKNLECASSGFQSAAGLKVGEMDGYAHVPDGRPSIIGAAISAASTLGISGADAAWSSYYARGVKPNYRAYPNWALVPRSGVSTVSPPLGPVGMN